MPTERPLTDEAVRQRAADWLPVRLSYMKRTAMPDRRHHERRHRATGLASPARRRTDRRAAASAGYILMTEVVALSGFVRFDEATDMLHVSVKDVASANHRRVLLARRDVERYTKMPRRAEHAFTDGMVLNLHEKALLLAAWILGPIPKNDRELRQEEKIVHLCRDIDIRTAEAQSARASRDEAIVAQEKAYRRVKELEHRLTQIGLAVGLPEGFEWQDILERVLRIKHTHDVLVERRAQDAANEPEYAARVKELERERYSLLREKDAYLNTLRQVKRALKETGILG